MSAALLADRAVFRVSGLDAREFLQGLITKDMRKITPGAPAFAALLSPQGRFLFDFFITEQDGAFVFDTDKARMQDLIKRLTMYRLRSKAEFTLMPELQVGALWADAPHDAYPEAYADPRLADLGFRVIGEHLTALAPQGEYDAHRIALGVPEGSRDLVFDRSILLEYGYDELGGVDFDKGCYVGQEVTARSKHRASLRKFVYRVQAESALPISGTQVMASGREAGLLLSVSDRLGLAHLRVEEVDRAGREGIALMAGNVAVDACLPDWCRTAFT